MSYTENLVDYVINAHTDSLPQEVIEHTKTFILDTIGCAIGGCCTTSAKARSAVAVKRPCRNTRASRRETCTSAGGSTQRRAGHHHRMG